MPFDPVDFSSAAPFNALSYYGHMLTGLVAWTAALVALLSRKGSSPHIWAGRIFLVAVSLVVITTFSLFSVRFSPPLFLAAVMTTYAMFSGYLALKPPTSMVRLGEYALFGFALVAVVGFLSIALPRLQAGEVPLFSVMMLLLIPVILLGGDINFFAKFARRKELRFRRHLSRMAWALVVVIRAPLTEIYANFGIPVPVVVFGPLLLWPLLMMLFWRKANAMGGRSVSRPS